MPQKPCGLVIEDRKKAILSGVKQVERFDDAAVILETWGGRLTLTGRNLHVSALQLEEGRLLVDGDIDGAAYEQARTARKGGFLRRALG